MYMYTVYWRLVDSTNVYSVNVVSNGDRCDAISDALEHIYNEERIAAEEIDICHVEVVR